MYDKFLNINLPVKVQYNNIVQRFATGQATFSLVIISFVVIMSPVSVIYHYNRSYI
jgi:hypothetical protein